MKLVVIMGLHRSGSSCLANLVNKLGVYMGEQLVGFEDIHGGGGEDRALMTACEEYMPFPGIETVHSEDWMRTRLDKIITKIFKESKGRVIGIKYPHLCVMGDMLTSISSDIKFIVPERPIEKSILSLCNREKIQPHPYFPDAMPIVQKHLFERREEFLARANPDVLRIGYDKMLDSPLQIAVELSEFLKIRPNALEIQNAMLHPKKEYRSIC